MGVNSFGSEGLEFRVEQAGELTEMETIRGVTVVLPGLSSPALCR
jgi:hypothetical protein